MVITNTCHVLSVLVLYRLTRLIFPDGPGKHLAFCAATLHIISPAGLFLSAPYAESLFSLLSFLGYLLYAESLREDERQNKLARDLCVLLAGASFGLATTVRNNGILNGIPFALDGLETVRLVLANPSVSAVRRLFVLLVGGICVALGAIIPQAVAYVEFCVSPQHLGAGAVRPWCSEIVPSIYSWVQNTYWSISPMRYAGYYVHKLTWNYRNVGFLKYWTLSNMPLFLIAAPMLAIMSASALWAIRVSLVRHLDLLSSSYAPSSAVAAKSKPPAWSPSKLTKQCLVRFALPQLILAVLALSSFHVQIITRISSGYVVWYWWLASAVVADSRVGKAKGVSKLPKLTVRWMVVYGIVQGGLFSSFLPPA